MINFLIWIIAGAFVGWVASLIMKTNNRQGLIADIFVGIVGAFVGGYLLMVIILLLIYIYVTCWPMELGSAFCTSVKALPFLQ